jgi:hypothetical protein
MSSKLDSLVGTIREHEVSLALTRLELYNTIREEIGISLTAKEAFTLWADYVITNVDDHWHSQQVEKNFIREVIAKTDFYQDHLVEISRGPGGTGFPDLKEENFAERFLSDSFRENHGGSDEKFAKDIETLMSLVIQYNMVRLVYV